MTDSNFEHARDCFLPPKVRDAYEATMVACRSAVSLSLLRQEGIPGSAVISAMSSAILERRYDGITTDPMDETEVDGLVSAALGRFGIGHMVDGADGDTGFRDLSRRYVSARLQAFELLDSNEEI
jgi:hypothetical protein